MATDQQLFRALASTPFVISVRLPFTPVCPGCGEPVHHDAVAWHSGWCACARCEGRPVEALQHSIGVLKAGALPRHTRYYAGLWFWVPRRVDFQGHCVLEIVTMLRCGSLTSEYDVDQTHDLPPIPADPPDISG